MKNLGVGPLLAMYANLGYAVVATDYSGLGADSGKPVLDMQSNALDVIYSVLAARAAVPQIGPKWIAVGPFQGALAAVAVAESEGHDPNYLGSVATSGVADAQSAYERFALRSSDRMLLVLASTVKALYPEFQVSDMLKDSALPAYQRVAQTCGGETEPEFTNEMLKPGWENNRVREGVFQQEHSRPKASPGPAPGHQWRGGPHRTGGHVGKSGGPHVQARRPNPFLEVSECRCQRRDGSVSRRSDQLDQSTVCRPCCAQQLSLSHDYHLWSESGSSSARLT